MSYVTDAGAKCTAQGGYGKFCDRESLPDAPFPICIKHASRLMRYMADHLAGAMDDQLRRAIDVVEKPPRLVPPRGGHMEDVVYYLRVGGLVKIGYTHNLPQRLLGYPPHAVLLASEPGDRKIEKMRHRQFRADLAERVEWFHPSPELVDHINDLRETPLTAAELAA